MDKRIMLKKDIKVGEHFILHTGIELEVLDETEHDYTVKTGFEDILISKEHCEVIK
jgi:hydrogenase maturation factor